MSQDFSIVVGGVRRWGYVWCGAGAWFISGLEGMVGMDCAFADKASALGAVRALGDLDGAVISAVDDAQDDKRAGRLPDNGAIHAAIWKGARELVLARMENLQAADDTLTLAYVARQYEALGRLCGWSARSISIWIASALDVLRARGLYSSSAGWGDISSDLLPRSMEGSIGPGYAGR